MTALKEYKQSKGRWRLTVECLTLLTATWFCELFKKLKLFDVSVLSMPILHITISFSWKFNVFPRDNGCQSSVPFLLTYIDFRLRQQGSTGFPACWFLVSNSDNVRAYSGIRMQGKSLLSNSPHPPSRTWFKNNLLTYFWVLPNFIWSKSLVTKSSSALRVLVIEIVTKVTPTVVTYYSGKTTQPIGARDRWSKYSFLISNFWSLVERATSAITAGSSLGLAKFPTLDANQNNPERRRFWF